MVLIAPSLLAADSANFEKEISALEKADADLLHFDVMDGHFVPNMTFGSHVLKQLKKCTSLPFDVHLMVNEPEKFIPWFAEAGADFLTFHLEATSQPDKLIDLIHWHDIKAGVTLKPGSDMNLLSKLKKMPDLVLIMSVEPGFGGQSFIADTPDKIALAKKMFGKDVLVEVDGGINPETAKLCVNAGADILVAGTAVFKNGNYRDNIKILKGEKL